MNIIQSMLYCQTFITILLRYIIIIFLFFNYLGIRGTQTHPENINCPPGYFGLECMNICPKSCNGTCDLVGQCYRCSQVGFRLPFCNDTCEYKTYGLNCLNKCSEHCFQEQCDAITGQCLQCNQVGKRLPNCTHDCTPGSYGLNCLQRCPLVCQNSCDPANGSCGQCPFGLDENCSVNCAMGSNKELCKLYCPGQCLTWCNVTNSKCSLCASGYRPPFCNTSCESTHFGINCKNICSHRCKDGQCDPITGACFSCTDGFVGRKCNGQCIKGYYGQDCELACSETCVNRSCDFVTGYCDECQAGYTGQQCQQLCESGKYGKNCLHNCSEYCLKACDPRSGMCWQCKPGYRDTYCNITCQEGSYGEGCKEMCPVDCICDHITGKCKNCYSNNTGPGCKPVTLNSDNTRNILSLFLYTLVGILFMIVVLSSIMWMYTKKVNIFWNKARQSITSKINDFNSGIEKHNKMDSLNRYETDADSLEDANAENEKHKKLVNYLRNYGKTYTPREYDKTELQIQYLKQIKTQSPSTFKYTLESCKNCAKESTLLPHMNVSISHTTVMECKPDSDDIVKHSYIEQKDINKYQLAALINTSYSYPRQSYRSDKDDTNLSKTLNKNKYIEEQSLPSSHFVGNEMDKNKVCGIVESSQIFLLGGANKKLTNTITCTTDTRSKLSEPLQVVKNRSLCVDQDRASADSLYGITSQEFAQDPYTTEGSKTAQARISLQSVLFPLDNSIENILNVTSKPTCSNNGPVLADQEIARNIPKSPSLFDREIKKPRDDLEQYNDLEVINSNEPICVKSLLVNHTSFKSALFLDNSLPSNSSHLNIKVKSFDHDSRKMQKPSTRRSTREVKNHSFSESTLSKIDQESCVEECSTFSDGPTLPSDTLSESVQEDTDHFIEMQNINTFKSKKKAYALKKKYRKISPPKCENKMVQLNSKHQSQIEAQQHRPSTVSQLDIHSIAQQPSVARITSSVSNKGDSPRLVRCGTTRQLSPMYAVRGSTVKHLKPLPTPPPDGKLSLKPVEKLSSSSSILEQIKDE